MPIYEYQCSNCGHQLEALQKFSDAPMTDCPECHQATLSKLVSAAGFQLKGSGWYVTDYSKKGKSKESDSAVNSSTTTKTETKTDTSSGSTGGGASST